MKGISKVSFKVNHVLIIFPVQKHHIDNFEVILNNVDFAKTIYKIYLLINRLTGETENNQFKSHQVLFAALYKSKQYDSKNHGFF